MEESRHLKLNEKKWDKWAETYDGNNWEYKYIRKVQRSVLPLLDIKKNMTFLDLGCGTGRAVGQVADLVNNKGTFYGVDLSAKMIAKAKVNFKGHKNFHFIKANAESIPLKNNLFDIIICTNSFHHYYHPDKVMEEIHRLLKSKGKIYILDPTADSWGLKLISKLAKFIESDHMKLYSSEEFKSLFINAGLKYVGTQKVQIAQKVHIGQK